MGSSLFTLIVYGNGFAANSVVYFNGNPLTTQYINPTQLNATLTSNFLTTNGTFNVFVFSSGLISNSLPFTVGSGSGITLSSLSQTSIPLNSPGFTLTLFGSGFTQGVLVNFGSYTVSSTFVNSGQLTVFIPAFFLTTVQSVNVSAGGSNSIPFAITGVVNVSCNPTTATITIGTFYSLTCAVTGGTAPYIWAVPSVPAGLTPNPAGSSLFISGTPRSVGVQTFSVNVADSSATPFTGSASVTLTVQASMKGTKVGVFRGNTAFLEDSNGNGIYDAGVDRYFPNFTGPGGFAAGDFPVVGDWTGDGTFKAGIYRSTTGQWFLDANNNGLLDAGDFTYGFGGVPGDLPVTGDWLGAGKTCVGIFREGFFWVLDLNCNGQFDSATDAAFPFGGIGGDVPVVGAWTGTGTRVGVVRKYAPGGVPTGDPFYWVLDGGAASAGSSPASHQPAPGPFAFGGLPGDVFVTGDWSNTGTFAAGVFRNGYWVLDGALPGAPQASHVPGLMFGYGGAGGDLPITGKW